MTDWSTRLARRTGRRGGALGDILAMAGAAGVINLSGGFPAPEVFPTDQLGAIVDRLLRDDAGIALQYAPSRGVATTLDAVADHLQAVEGRRPASRELMITSGGIDAVTLIASTMLDPGDAVVVEEPSYLGAVDGFAAYEPTLHGVAVDSGGLDVEALAAMLAGGLRPKVLYTVPDFQNPTGRTLSLGRRHRLVELARRYGLLIAEDVAYRELALDEDAPRLPSLWALAPDTVVQVGTFAKTFFPGVRLGWAAGPAAVVEQLVLAKQNSDQCAGALGQRMVEEFLRAGLFGPQLARQRAVYASRGAAMARALHAYLPADVSWTEPAGGFFTWLRVPGVDTAALVAPAREMSVAFVPGAPFFACRVEHEYLRLSFSGTSESRIDTGVRRLATAIETLRAA